MTAPRFRLRERYVWLAVAVYAAIFLPLGVFAAATAHYDFLLYAAGILAIAVPVQRLIHRMTMFLEFRPDQLRVRQWKTGVRATYSLIDSIISNREEGEIAIYYRLTLPGGKVTTYRLRYSFWPREPALVENELRCRVDAAKASKVDTARA